MKIEVGKRYRMRNGKLATVTSIRDEEARGSASTAVQIDVEGRGVDFCCRDGSYYSSGNENPLDLVEEVADEQAVEAAAEAFVDGVMGDADAGPLPDLSVIELSPGPVPGADPFASIPPPPSATERLLQGLATATHDVEAATANRRAAEQALAAAIEQEQDAGAKYEDARRELDRNVTRLSARRAP